MCLQSKLIKNRKYQSNKKNNGIWEKPKDERVLIVSIPCGKCIECKKKEQRKWLVRLSEEMKDMYKKKIRGHFVTLTFSTESLKELSIGCKKIGYEKDNYISKKGVRRFLERWRKLYGKSVKHWLVTEIGGGRYEHIHIHGIIWTNEINKLEEIWKYGYVFIGNKCDSSTIGYITKYIGKYDEKHKHYNSKVFCSPGIGGGYVERIGKDINKIKEQDFYRLPTGQTIELNDYYRNKIYNDEEKEKLWLKKLDNKERYVMGKRIDIKNGLDEYIKAKKFALEESKKYGFNYYATEEEERKEKDYENMMRELNYKERLEE